MGKKEDEEALRKMLDDLGIHRVEELPMDDDIGGGPPRRPNNEGAPPPVAQQPQRALNGKAGEYASIWQAAIDAGTFRDRDYEGVKDLDDLGDESGRLYANRPRGGYGDMPAHPELHGNVARRFHASGRELPPNALIRFDKKIQVSKLGIVQLDGDAPIKALNNHKGTTATQMNPGAPPRPQCSLPALAAMAPRSRVQQGGSRLAPVNSSNLRPQQGGAHPATARLDRPPQPQNPHQHQASNAPSNAGILVPNPENIVFEAPIQYVAQRRGKKETPGKVTLNQPPKKGIFRLFVMDKLYAEHGLGDFQNYTHNREEATIIVRFTDPNDNSHTAKDKGGKRDPEEAQKEHTLKFQTGDAAFEFLETYNLIWAGVNVDPIPVKKPAQATNQRSSTTGAANSANTTGRATQNGPGSSVARRPAPAQIGHSPHPTRDGPAPPATRNGAPPQVAHWGARLAAATDFDPFSVTIGSPRSQVQSPGSTIVTRQPSQAHLRPPPGLPLPRGLAPPPGLSAPTSGVRAPPGLAQPRAERLAIPSGHSDQQPNLDQPPKAASKPLPSSSPAETMGPSKTTDIGKVNQIKPESAKSNDIQPETRNPTAGNDASAPGVEDILKALTKIAGIIEAGAKEPVDMASVQAVAKLLVSLIPGKLDNLFLGSLETSNKKETGEPSQKKESVKSPSDPRERGESSGDSWMLVEAAETSESAISRKGCGTRTNSKPSAAKHGGGSSSLRHLQYSENELRAFRPNAVRPPHWLNELRFLPARGENAHRAPAPAPRPMPSLEEQIERIKASAYEVNLGNQAASSGYVVKQVEHIKAVIHAPNESVADTVGEAAAKTSVKGPEEAAPETGAQENSGKVGVENAKIVSNPSLDTEDSQRVATPQARSAGLQASVWAAGEARVEHPHAFAGAIPEYPQHSYFNDLLLLVDDPVTNTASSNLGGEEMPEAQEVQEQSAMEGVLDAIGSLTFQPSPTPATQASLTPTSEGNRQNPRESNQSAERGEGQSEAPRVLGLGASRHAGPSAPAPRGDKPPYYPPNQRF